MALALVMRVDAILEDAINFRALGPVGLCRLDAVERCDGLKELGERLALNNVRQRRRRGDRWLFVRLSGEVIHIRLRELIGGWLGVLSRSVLCVVPLVAAPTKPANVKGFGVVVMMGVSFDGVAADFAGLRN
jgi:hypothetical protein